MACFPTSWKSARRRSAIALTAGSSRSGEKRYLEIVGKYTKDEINRFAQMFARLVLSFEKRVEDMRVAGAGLTDVLGETYMMLEISNAHAGQFFTPYEISRLMAKMIIGDGGDAVKLHGFMRLQEPACGAAGMVIAAAESLNDGGTTTSAQCMQRVSTLTRAVYTWRMSSCRC
jgi:type I restriction-modification system DNA methylase subunit